MSIGQGDTGAGYKAEMERIIDDANSGNTGYFGKAEWQIIADNPGYTTASAAANQPQGGGDTPAAAAGGPDPYTEYLRQEQARLEQIRTKNASAVMEGLMASYGLGDLAGQITTWIQEGYESDALQALIRQTPQYAERFPAMKALQAKGKSITESEYIAYERTMGQYEKLFGLPSGMLSSKDMVTKSLTNELSAQEVEDRATRASASIYSLPAEFRTMMQTYYGVDSGGLTAYFLDPEVANPMLEKQYVSAQIGMEAGRQGIGIGVDMAEQLNAVGIDRTGAASGFAQVKAQEGLSQGRGDTASQDTLIGANLKKSAEAITATERAAKSRVNRFEGGGGFAGDKSGNTGLGSA